MLDFVKSRRMMVDNQLRTFDVTNRAVLAAVEAVPREAFVQPGQEALAYTDAGLPTGRPGRTLLAPMVLARLIQLLAPQEGEKVLVVGGATGYGAAILAQMGCEVTMLDDEDFADEARDRLGTLGVSGITVETGALSGGASNGAPYDAILVEGAFEVAPAQLAAQLKDGGRLAGVDAGKGAPRAVLLSRSGTASGAVTPFDAPAAVLPGFGYAPSFVF